MSRKSRSRSAEDAGGEPLACPSCATFHPLDERFCPDCGMPLVHVGAAAARGEAPRDAAHERARKIRPEYARGELVRVAWAANQAEAELVAGLLLEEGVPSLIRRNAGFDVPDFLAAGPRDVLVPASGEQAARELLAAVEGPAPAAGESAPPLGQPARARSRHSHAARALAALLAAVLIGLVLARALMALL